MTEHSIAPATPAMKVSYTVEDGVAILGIDNPPVNVSTAEVRAGLLAGLATADADADVDRIVLIGSGANFISGSDLHEFDGPLAEPQLPAVIAAVEASPKPVVAALSGTTLGGGFELALGCDARIALAGGWVGLPEITLGMIPGAGGTQRPLRLIGPARTIDLITSGTRLPVEQAHREGLIDRVVATDLRRAAISFARELSGKRVLRQCAVREYDPGEITRAAQRALGRSGARPQTVAAVGAVLTGISAPAHRAFEHERAEFNRLRNGCESRALRHLFFARRAATKANRPREPRWITTVGVVGAGTMGGGIARAFLESGKSVIVVDQQPHTAAAMKARLSDTYQSMVDAGRLEQHVASARLGQLTVGQSLADLGECDLVIEAVFEDFDVKLDVLASLQRVLGADVPIATNTSYLDIDALAGVVADKGRLVGMHFFSPAHRISVLEIVQGRHTSLAVMDVAFSAAKALGKVPIVAGVCDGFIGNRIYNAYRRQCELMLEEGAVPHEIDTALREFGFAMGPFAVSDMSGLDVAWRMRQRKAATRDPRERYPDVADALCEQGRFGQKTGAGWYRYEPGARIPLPDEKVHHLIEASARRKGITRRTMSAAEIVERALITMANEAALILAERIAERAGDIDLMLTLGYGFPTHQGGISYWAARQDPSTLPDRLEAVAARTGYGFVRGDLSLLTADLNR
jgi:3-hydroxyacyl-CoA dehydrogenase